MSTLFFFPELDKNMISVFQSTPMNGVRVRGSARMHPYATGPLVFKLTSSAFMSQKIYAPTN